MHLSISCDKFFVLVSRYLSLWPWPSLGLATIEGICVSQTHLVILYWCSFQLFKMCFWYNKKWRDQGFLDCTLMLGGYFNDIQLLWRTLLQSYGTILFSGTYVTMQIQASSLCTMWEVDWNPGYRRTHE